MSDEALGGNAAAIAALNSANEAAQFDDMLSGYFQVAVASQKRARGRAGRDVQQHPSAFSLPAAETIMMSPEGYLKQLKRVLRLASPSSQSQYVHRLFAAIIHQLKRAKKTPTVFSRVVTLCREIFQRSVAFRALIATQTASFYERLLVAAGEELKSSGASRMSRALRAKARASPQLTMALALIETWKQDFGDRYPPLVAGHAVLMERGYVFPRERERQQEARQQAVDTRRHRDRVCEAKRHQRDHEMAQTVPEMEQLLVEMNRIFEILVPTLDAFQVDGDTEIPPANGAGIEPLQDKERDEDDSDGVQWEDAAPPTATSVHAQDEEEGEEEEEEEEGVDWETVAPAEYEREDAGSEEEAEHRMDINDIIQAYGLGSSSYQLTVEVSTRVCKESADNAVLFQTLADGTLRLRKRFLPLLDDWEQYSTGPGPSASNSSTPGATRQREILQRIGDLRDRMTRVLLKWEDLIQDKKPASTSVAPAVVTLPLASYDPPAKRPRRRTTRL